MTPAEMLADARAKLHQLYTGRLAVKVTIEGQETEFNSTTIPLLEAYVQRLARQVEGCTGGGAIGIWF
jgi:hypothetical protein